jgi:hypothetical protein
MNVLQSLMQYHAHSRLLSKIVYAFVLEILSQLIHTILWLVATELYGRVGIESPIQSAYNTISSIVKELYSDIERIHLVM